MMWRGERRCIASSPRRFVCPYTEDMPREDVVGGDMDEEDAEALGELREACYGKVVDFVRLLGLVFGTVDSGVGRTVDDDFDALTGSELLDS